MERVLGNSILAIFYFGYSDGKYGRRHLAMLAAEIRSIDKRPPVVYLRNFSSDELTSQTIVPDTGTSAPNVFYRLEHSTTEEEQLAEGLSYFGPFIGLGKHGGAGANARRAPHVRWSRGVTTTR